MNVEKEIMDIKDRNVRVELDKAWEVSWTRRIFITVATYIIASVWLWTIGNNHPFLNAAIPAGGFLLSTLTLPFVKERWKRGKK
ncbi:hypothetical protein COU13_01755 [Candidatus Kaiserbacteria bacterium CG10_big_fil_rev_8_21_14_0_10_43_70]|uniref:2TM domain-containing protein n=1 Tax=Candidatus Kaiserbacteria bacterium CG10_big_fil_rev_8_21_14_0_10_43_70 TaxID=1974605 RepID=A0A2H0UIT0_9BACT|nr:MAG: hypothetical protein COU13_01755 [Candidatus Kaiserbacteria bacterium CG10_big_fil_rev_8_21_14_0_10_43_70]